MASEVSICNQALSWLGANLIMSLDDPTTEAAICKANYPGLRDAMLAEIPWTFATKRIMLTPEANVPVYGYEKQFLLPSTHLRVLEVQTNAQQANGANYIEWRKEGDKLMLDNDVVYVKYIDQILDTTLFSASFVQALAARMAWDLALPITNSVKAVETMERLFMQKLSAAATLDGMQGASEVPEATRMLSARYGGSGFVGEFGQAG